MGMVMRSFLVRAMRGVLLDWALVNSAKN